MTKRITKKGIEATFTDEDDLPFDVTLVIAVVGTKCLSASFSSKPGGPPVTGEHLRRVALGELVKRATQPADFDPWATAGSHEPPIVIAARIRVHGFTDDDLETIANLYTEAESHGFPPTQVVANQFEVSRSTAGRWVAEARRRGLLPKRSTQTRGM